MVFYVKDVSNYRAGSQVSTRERLYFFALILWFLLCTAGIIYLLDDFNELRVHYWVWAFVFALGLEFMVV